MNKFNIDLRIKISNKEYDKIKNVKNKSSFVRNAINAYNYNDTLNAEISKKEILEEIKNKVEEEEKILNNKIKIESLKGTENILNELNIMYDKIENNIKDLTPDNEQKDSEKTSPEDDYEKRILEILPTLQGAYYSDNGLNYEFIRTQAQKININTKNLKDWIEEHPKIIQDTTHIFREPLIHRSDEPQREYKL